MNTRTIEEFYQVNPKHIPELYALQVELLKLQKHIADSKKRVAILFEGRDTAGKGRAIIRFTQFLNPRFYRTVALGKPTARERGQWYFQRYLKRLPNAGEMVFFDRSWYNRAVVEPVMGFCSHQQYQDFMEQVNLLENMLTQDGIVLIKFWFSIDVAEQKARIQRRLDSPLQRWKVSPVDLAAQEKWQDFTRYKKTMFENTSSEFAPWLVIRGKDRENGRIQAMKYVLSQFEYPEKNSEITIPDSSQVSKPIEKDL